MTRYAISSPVTNGAAAASGLVPFLLQVVELWERSDQLGDPPHLVLGQAREGQSEPAAIDRS